MINHHQNTIWGIFLFTCSNLFFANPTNKLENLPSTWWIFEPSIGKHDDPKVGAIPKFYARLMLPTFLDCGLKSMFLGFVVPRRLGFHDPIWRSYFSTGWFNQQLRIFRNSLWFGALADALIRCVFARMFFSAWIPEKLMPCQHNLYLFGLPPTQDASHK